MYVFTGIRLGLAEEQKDGFRPHPSYEGSIEAKCCTHLKLTSRLCHFKIPNRLCSHLSMHLSIVY